jgi:hypothetical protein
VDSRREGLQAIERSGGVYFSERGILEAPARLFKKGTLHAKRADAA